MRMARDIVSRGLSHGKHRTSSQTIRRTGQCITYAKSMVGKGIKATAHEARTGATPARQIAGRVDVNTFRAAGQSKEKVTPLFAAFGHALADSINRTLQFDSNAEKLAEIVKVIHQVVDEDDRVILQRIDFELDQLGERTQRWRKRLTRNKVKPFPAPTQIGAAK